MKTKTKSGATITTPVGHETAKGNEKPVEARLELIAMGFETGKMSSPLLLVDNCEPLNITPLPGGEASRFGELEDIITAGLNTFQNVGDALWEIRERKLYRCVYKTFQEYCRFRWGFSRQYAYRLMDAGQVVREMSTRGDKVLPTTERQARELKTVPASSRETVLIKANFKAKGGKATAKAIKTAKAEAPGEDRTQVHALDDSNADVKPAHEEKSVELDTESKSESERSIEQEPEGKEDDEDDGGESGQASRKIIDIKADIEQSEPVPTLFEVVDMLDELKSRLPDDRIPDDVWELFNEIRASIHARAVVEEKQTRRAA